MKKFVIIAMMVVVMLMVMTGCGKHEVTKNQGIGLGQVYQLDNGEWIYFSSEGAVEIGR